MSKLDSHMLGKCSEEKHRLAECLQRKGIPSAPLSNDCILCNAILGAQAPDVQLWLRRACGEATEGSLAESAGDYACARQEAFPASDDNAHRHLRVSDFSDAVAALPPEELQVTQQ